MKHNEVNKLKELAKKTRTEADRKAKILEQKAKEIEFKEFRKFKEQTIKFLNEDITKDELKSFAIENNFIENKQGDK